MELLGKVERLIADERLFEPEDSIVVAVSGGPDSVALLHILFLLSPKWRLRLVVAHVNHRFRGSESEREADFTAGLAARLGIPFQLGDIDVPAYIQATGLNGQDAARQLRYAFLHETASSFGAGKIALAHHADDQAETVLMRVIRGTGVSGLSGMPLRRKENNLELIRPLLRNNKSELLAYCDRHGLEYCTDSSNATRKYTRNRIRLDVMPQLKAFNPMLTESLNRLAITAAEEDDFMERAALGVFSELTETDEGRATLSRVRFGGLHVALQRRLIKLILSYLSGGNGPHDFARMESARTAILQERPTTLIVEMGGGVSLLREYDRIRFTRHMRATAAFRYPLSGSSGDLSIPEAGIHFRYRVMGLKEAETTDTSPMTAFFDAERLKQPLAMRNRKDGDRIWPYGLNGSKKVKDIFIDGKVPPSDRSRTPLLVDAEDRILWIPGIRRSSVAPLTAETSRVFRIEAAVR
jgi:tRNA(Ile)-lysidine synthase